MHHSLSATRENLHGHFSTDLPPALTISPGDTVTFECLDANWGLEPHNGIDIHRSEITRRPGPIDTGHALTGPVYVKGAKAGMTLEVRIEQIVLGDWGTTYVGGWPCDWSRKLGIEDKGIFMIWTFDREAGRAVNQFGHSVLTEPFMGVYGMPTAEPGILSTIPPRRTGGNIDCKELVAGSTLYLPIEVDGGLFSTGDGHAAQGDGEVCVTAIESPMSAVRLSFDVREALPITRPVANTPRGWLAIGLGATLDDAMLDAIESMVSLLKWLHGLDRLQAMGICSVAVDFRVTQTVNEVAGVHALLPHGTFKQS